MSRRACLLILLLGAGCDRRPAAPPPAPAPTLTDRTLSLELLDKKVDVRARVPDGWRQRGNTFDPPDGDRLPIWHARISYSISCGGSCEPADVDKAVKGLAAEAKRKWEQPNFNTGKPELDAVRAPVDVLGEGELAGGGTFITMRVHPPKESGPYADLLAASCFRHRAGDGFYVATQVTAAPGDDKTIWPLLVEACKATMP